jgi:hypothetical protein
MDAPKRRVAVLVPPIAGAMRLHLRQLISEVSE